MGVGTTVNNGSLASLLGESQALLHSQDNDSSIMILCLFPNVQSTAEQNRQLKNKSVRARLEKFVSDKVLPTLY